MIKGKPFVKWAGGKRQIVDKLLMYAPDEFNTYYEPFVGGGALLFELSPKKAVINDSNKELINVYSVLRNEEKFKKMCSILNTYEKNNSEEFYYELRNKDRNKSSFDRLSDYKRAGRTIYLNKACFNGLYRVNKNGEFNVPCGKYKNPTICDSKNLRNLSFLIRNVEFQYGDYKKSEKYVDSNTFVYFDPPYRPLSITSGFTSYTKEDFNDENQKELANYFKELDEKKAKLMLSNSNPKNTNKEDNFFEEIYKGFNINEISAKRMINANCKGRGAISELLITNYEEN